MKIIKITLKRSLNGRTERQKACVIGLGLTKKINSTRRVIDTPSIRGMINKVHFLLEVEELA